MDEFAIVRGGIENDDVDDDDDDDDDDDVDDKEDVEAICGKLADGPDATLTGCPRGLPPLLPRLLLDEGAVKLVLFPTLLLVVVVVSVLVFDPI